MEEINFKLQYIDDGYGITNYQQTIDLFDNSIEFKVVDLQEKETVHANALATQTWFWYV